MLSRSLHTLASAPRYNLDYTGRVSSIADNLTDNKVPLIFSLIHLAYVSGVHWPLLRTFVKREADFYKSFEIKMGEAEENCQAACAADNKCRAWTFARAGYVGKDAHCYLKKDIKPPRRKAGYISGVVR